MPLELVAAIAFGIEEKCDKSTRRAPCVVEPNLAAAICPDCSKVYARCSRHGGERGALRSLHSHRALYHPKKVSTT